jgi:flagellar biosynthesis protein FlhB
MADKPAAERSEQPTAKKLYKARMDGQVPTSVELISALVLGAMLLTLYLTGTQLIQWFTGQIREGMACDRSMFMDPGAFAGFARDKVVAIVWVLAPSFIAITVASVAGSLMVSGFNISSKMAMKFNLDALNPINGFQQFFSSRSLINLLLSIAKLIFIGIIVYAYLKDRLDDLAALRWVWSREFLSIMGGMIFGVVARILMAVGILAVFDVAYQKWKYIHDLKMTKQEVTQERKQEEGSPEVKRKLRLVQFEMVRKRMMQQVPKANVVLVNPTHVAVAIQYNSKEMNAPVVVAKGGDLMAEKIKEIARAHGIPIIRRKELARTIFETVEVNEPISEGLYVAVAEILAMIHRLRKRRQ